MEMRDRSGLRRPWAQRVRPRRRDVRAGHAARLHRREPRLRERRHRRPAGAEPAGLPARAGLGDAEPRRRGVHGGRRRLALLRRRRRARRQLLRPVERGRPVALRPTTASRSTSARMAGQDIGGGKEPRRRRGLQDRRGLRAVQLRQHSGRRRANGAPTARRAGAADDRAGRAAVSLRRLGLVRRPRRARGRSATRGTSTATAPRTPTSREARHAYAAAGELRRQADRDATRGGRTELGDGADHRDRRRTGPAGRPGRAAGRRLVRLRDRQRLQSLQVTPKGAGLRFTFARRRPGRVVADVFRAAKGAQVTKMRRVARFASRTRRSPTRRGARSRGRTSRASRCGPGGSGSTPAAPRSRAATGASSGARRSRCATAAARSGRSSSSARCSAGRASRSRVSFKLAKAPGRAVIDLLRGRKVVRKVSSRRRTGLRTHRLKIRPRELARGEYRSACGSARSRKKLSARRLWAA